VLQGELGKINVKGRDYSLDGYAAFRRAFSDEQLASILTYIRRSWEHTAAPIERDTVKKYAWKR
jgi:hypothetical protein